MKIPADSVLLADTFTNPGCKHPTIDIPHRLLSWLPDFQLSVSPLLALDRQGYYQHTHPLLLRVLLNYSLKNNSTRPGKSADIPHHSLTWLPDFLHSFPFLR